jgi:adenylate kinase
MVRLVILGGPGAGKGTQSSQLCEALGLLSIATGDMLRTAIAQQTDLGKQIAVQVAQGELVADESMIDLIRDRLTQDDIPPGWLLDGYPRTAFQAEELDFLLDTLNQRMNYALFLQVPTEVLVQRCLGRARADDTPDSIERRIALFNDVTTPLLDYYAMQRRLIRINGDQPTEKVHKEILERLGIRG